MNGRWGVWNALALGRAGDEPGWVAGQWDYTHDDYVGVAHFPTWREAFDYAFRMARAER